MPAITLLHTVPGTAAGKSSSVSPQKSTAQRLFSALFAGHFTPVKGSAALPDKVSSTHQSKPGHTDKSDNVTPLLALLAAPLIAGKTVSAGTLSDVAEHPLDKMSAVRLPPDPIQKTIGEAITEDHQEKTVTQPDAVILSASRRQLSSVALQRSHDDAPQTLPLTTMKTKPQSGPVAESPAAMSSRPPQAPAQEAFMVAAVPPENMPLRRTMTEVRQPQPLAAGLLPADLSAARATHLAVPEAVPARVMADPQALQQQLSQQLIFMHQKGLHSAEMRLHPRELGSLQISLVMKNEQTDITFLSGHSQVRTALEAALPQLRHALAESGISLGQSHVGSDDASSSGRFNPSAGSGEQQHHLSSADLPGQQRGGSPEAAGGISVSRLSPATEGRVDLFV